MLKLSEIYMELRRMDINVCNTVGTLNRTSSVPPELVEAKGQLNRVLGKLDKDEQENTRLKKICARRMDGKIKVETEDDW